MNAICGILYEVQYKFISTLEAPNFLVFTSEKEAKAKFKELKKDKNIASVFVDVYDNSDMPDSYLAYTRKG